MMSLLRGRLLEESWCSGRRSSTPQPTWLNSSKKELPRPSASPGHYQNQLARPLWSCEWATCSVMVMLRVCVVLLPVGASQPHRHGLICIRFGRRRHSLPRGRLPSRKAQLLRQRRASGHTCHQHLRLCFPRVLRLLVPSRWQLKEVWYRQQPLAPQKPQRVSVCQDRRHRQRLVCRATPQRRRLSAKAPKLWFLIEGLPTV